MMTPHSSFTTRSASMAIVVASLLLVTGCGSGANASKVQDPNQVEELRKQHEDMSRRELDNK